jgi:TonB family protein
VRALPSDLVSPARAICAKLAEAMKPPHVLPRTPHAHAAWAKRHPHDRQFVGRIVALSIGLHVFFAAIVVVLALWLDRITFSKSSSVQQSGPAAEQVTMNLLMPEARPPSPAPPTPKPTPEPGLPVVPVIQPSPKPPAVVSIVPPPPVPAPKTAPPTLTVSKPPTPAPSPSKATTKPSNKPRPKYVATDATGQGTAPDISSEELAKLGYPAPNYPPQAQSLRQTGTVLMEVGFGPDGRVTNAQVRQSSGFTILDMSTRSFIRVHWKDIARANTTISVPIIYTLK